jgi:ketosteroid isomerase-like protein
LALACHVAGRSVTAQAGSSSTVSAVDDNQQLLNLEQEWVTAENQHDAATLRRILDDKFVSSSGSKPIDKETFIRDIVSGDVDPSASQTLTDRTVIVDGDTAVVVGTDTAAGVDQGAAYTVVFRYTVTYIRRQGQWRALAEHLVRVP